MSINNVID